MMAMCSTKEKEAKMSPSHSCATMVFYLVGLEKMSQILWAAEVCAVFFCLSIGGNFLDGMKVEPLD